jgi:uncharacterized protein YndB with AHSA1/START domain
MKRVAGLVATAMMIAGHAGAAPAAESTSVALVQGKAADGTRFYEDSLVIRAPATTLWKAFTDAKTYQAWAAPVSAVDFRLGGVIEASYDPKGHLGDPDNIKNALIAYLPERLLVFRNVQAPSMLPGRAAYPRTVKVLEFTALGPDETRVAISGVGFGEGRDFDQLYAFFSTGDGEMLKALKTAFEK